MTPVSEAIPRPAVDLDNPADLIRECEAMRDGLGQQAAASKTGTALSGHPYPAFFFGRVAAVLDACARMIQKQTPPPPAAPDPPQDKPPEPKKK